VQNLSAEILSKVKDILKSNKLLLLLLVVSILTPVFAVNGVENNIATITPQDMLSPVGVEAGHTIKYTINDVELPAAFSIPNITLPADLSGHEVYVKVLDVDNSYQIEPTVSTVMVYFAVGLIFTDNVIVQIGEGITATSITIPSGAATPALGFSGLPHLNLTTGYQFAMFCLNDDWALHQLFLESAGFTVTNDLEALTATIGDETAGAEMSWRKSDGILTDLMLADIDLIDFGLNFTDASIDISLDNVELNDIDLAVDDEIILHADTAMLDITGSGELFSGIETFFSEPESLMDEIKDNDVMKFVITDVQGLFYEAELYAYDTDTQSLVKQNGSMVFCAFLGNMPISYLNVPEIAQLGNFTPLVGPVITPDWDIYGGYAIFAHALVNIYLEDLVDLITSEITTVTGLPDFNTLKGTVSLTTNGNYYYFRQTFNLDLEMSLDDFSIPTTMAAQEVTMDLLIDMSLREQGWIAYTSDGILAGMRMKVAMDMDIDYDLGGTTSPAGTMTMDMDMKLTNPDYIVPDPLAAGGIIPGYTWMIAIPAIFGVATVAVIIRKRK
jgi:hypothetical protein